MRTSLFVMLFFPCLILKSQDVSKVKDATNICVFGIDFSKSKMVGALGIDFKDPDQIVDYYFQTWNTILISEADKYNISLALNKETVYRLDSAIAYSRKVDPDQIVTSEAIAISDAEVSEIIKRYVQESNVEIGLLFIAENYNKMKESASYIVVFFEIKTGEILISKKLTGKPSGFGFRNYWANCMEIAIKNMKYDYPLWIKGKK